MARDRSTSRARTAGNQAELVPSEADLEALALPCRDDEHYPFSFKLKDAPGETLFPHAWVRTTSWEWDGCGGRTDLQEIFGLLWALLLRARGAASAAFIDESGFGGPGEIYARSLLFLQPFDRFYLRSNARLSDLLKGHSAAAAHALFAILGIEDLDETPPTWQQKSLPWLDKVRAHLGGEDPDELFVERTNPDWRYYGILRKGICWLELPPQQILLLRYACRFYKPKTVRQGSRLITSSGGLHNAIAVDALRKAERALQLVDETPYVAVGDASWQWDSENAFVIPLENRLVVIGGRFVVSIATMCGHRAYVNARGEWEEKNRQAASIFGLSGSIEWQEKIDSARFEALVEALLGVEPNVVRVRSAGPHTERDQGRDLIVDKLAVAFAEGHAATGTERILVQVKTRTRTIGKADVQDIRDTIGHHEARGYLLVAYPRLSGDLINHLERLAAGGLNVDWWTRTQLEERLRKHPHIATQFADLLVHRPPD